MRNLPLFNNFKAYRPVGSCHAVETPFRCMFVLDQKLTSGQRVTLRLLEDYNQDGVRIPANTHLAAICKIGDRLELQVRSLEMNGRIIPLALDAYDTDGLQGIYCPETSAGKNAKKPPTMPFPPPGRPSAAWWETSLPPLSAPALPLPNRPAASCRFRL